MSWIKEGEKYRLRGGKTAHVVRLGELQFGFQQRQKVAVWVGHIGNDTTTATWSLDGKYSDEGDHAFDIIGRPEKKPRESKLAAAVKKVTRRK